jgi:O-antigen/teichoic acid export membrane protein
VVQLPAASLSYLLPAVAASLGYRLPAITALLVVARIVAAMAMLLLLVRLVPFSFRRVAVDRRLLRQLFGFGGWVTVASLFIPFLANLERFLIGALASITAVAQYAAPADMASRVAIFPASISASLFPALSSLGGAGERARQRSLLLRALRILVLTLGPVAIVMVAFARDIIRIWLGPQFAASVPVLQVVAAAILINASSWLALTAVQANGRPDLQAKFYALELVVYVPIAWLLVSRYGAAGAAWAWAVRVTMDAGLLWAAALKLLGMRASAVAGWSLWRRILPVAGFGAAMILAGSATLGARMLFASCAAVAYAASIWMFGLELEERRTLISGLYRVRMKRLDRGC